MSSKNNKWNLDRAPTKSERVVAVIGGTIISLLFAFFAIGLLLNSNYLPATIVILLSVYSISVAFRAARSEGKRPSKTSMKAVIYFFIFIGLALIIVSPLIPKVGAGIMTASFGFTALGFALHNLRVIKFNNSNEKAKK